MGRTHERVANGIWIIAEDKWLITYSILHERGGTGL
jgi:hypothetical protein